MIDRQESIDGRQSEPVDILLVEDNPGDVRLTREAFGEVDLAHELHVVNDGQAAVDFLFQRGEYADAPRPELVFLDLNLPKKSGIEVLKEIKVDSSLHRIPIVVLTGSTAREDVVESYEQYSNAYLTKPIDPDEFVELIQSFERFWLSLVQLPPAPRQ